MAPIYFFSVGPLVDIFIRQILTYKDGCRRQILTYKRLKDINHLLYMRKLKIKITKFTLFTLAGGRVFIQHVAIVAVTRERTVCVVTDLFTSSVTG